jgi:hypothetical protein
MLGKVLVRSVQILCHFLVFSYLRDTPGRNGATPNIVDRIDVKVEEGDD